MSSKPGITVIGAANIDLIGYPKNKLIYRDSNTGTLETILGGVGRNIAENLSHLGFHVEFISVFGEDDFARQIIASCDALQISTDHCKFIKNTSSSVYMAIMDQHNDMALGLDAMSIYDKIPDTFILDNLEVIAKNKLCVLETNMPEGILQLVTEKAPSTRFALDAVSGKKALKAKLILNRLSILKCNLVEAELLSGIAVKSEKDLNAIILYFIDLGIEKIFITLGAKGVIYGDARGVYRAAAIPVKPVNTTGAGDSFMAGLLYGETQNYTIHKMAEFAGACARITVQHNKNVHPEISKELVLKHIE